MFLDDQMYEKVQNFTGSTQEDIQDLYAELCRMCEVYWQKILSPEIEKRKMKTQWDRTFNLWDSFVRKLHADDDVTSTIFANLFEKHTYKKEFFKDETLTRIYNES